MRSTATLLILLCAAASRLPAQERFVTQVLLVPTFHGPDVGIAHRAGDLVRNRIADAFHGRELDVISAGQVASWLQKSGYDEDMVLAPTGSPLSAPDAPMRLRVTGGRGGSGRGTR